MSYQPGTHLIATLHTDHESVLDRFDRFRELVDALIPKLGLQKLGEVYHRFEPGGFTAVVCLSESHLSIHTWPEFGKVNLDIYLSNHLRQNDGTVDELFAAIRTHFGGEVVHLQTIKR